MNLIDGADRRLQSELQPPEEQNDLKKIHSRATSACTRVLPFNTPEVTSKRRWAWPVPSLRTRESRVPRHPHPPPLK